MIKILLVEDNFEHAKLMQLILERKKVPAHISVARDGIEAINYLLRSTSAGTPVRNPRPDLILLDLNTPRFDGRKVLHRLKSSKSLKDIPVVVVSTSEKPDDRAFAAREGAMEYICKSTGFEEWSEKLSRVYEFTPHVK